MVKKPVNDITGQVFGHLQVVRMELLPEKGRGFYAICKCLNCGKEEFPAVPAVIKAGTIKGCGCLISARRTEDLTGKTFGHLEVTSMQKVPEKSRAGYLAICKCNNCGKENHAVVSRALIDGQRSCGCVKDHYLGIAKGNAKNWRGAGELSGTAFGNIRYRAKTKGTVFEVTVEYLWQLFLDQDRSCALTGVGLVFPLRTHNSEKRTGTASVDRIDSSKGYVEGNVQWVHKTVNAMKLSHFEEEFVEWCRKVVNHSEETNDENQ